MSVSQGPMALRRHNLVCGCSDIETHIEGLGTWLKKWAALVASNKLGDWVASWAAAVMCS